MADINFSLLQPEEWKILILPLNVNGLFFPLFPTDTEFLPDQSELGILPLLHLLNTSAICVIRIQEGERDFHLSATNLLNLGLVDALK
jgi:hypothetical protein